MAQYDYLIVGAGLFGSTFAQQATERGKSCLVIDRRSFIGGNLHSQKVEGIPVHQYGPHIFHTSDLEVWAYVNRFSRFNHFISTPIARCRGKMYSLPINLNTFAQLWGTYTPEQARAELARQAKAEGIDTPHNLEEQALKMFGREVYETLIRGYIEKLWRKSCRELPASLIQNLKVRFTYDNRFYEDTYQGIPLDGYDVMIQRMLAGCEVRLGTEYMGFGRAYPDIANKTIFTGMIDEFFRFRLGELEYTTLSYEYEVIDSPDCQGCAIVNYVDPEIPCTRSIEYKHFLTGMPLNANARSKTVIGREIPILWRSGLEPYFPAKDERNRRLYESYRALSVSQPDVIFAGRLATYHNYSMDETVRAALDLAKRELK